MSSRENVNGKWNANNISTSALADRSPGFGRCVRLCTCLCERISERGWRSASLASEHTVLVQVETKHEKNVSDASDGVSERCQSLNWKPPSIALGVTSREFYHLI